ncbi:MAG: sulfate ABC transporter substrate-binding protein [Alphaproteobacteria bacterium]|nr:MAG: sulfate ABC transporter substrate-binding protein [Alphaproteobacteria bacterium]
MKLLSLFSALLLSVLVSANALADDIKMAVTTSFHNSGLADVLLPAAKKDLNLDIYLLIVGTGQALKLGRQGDVDAVLVHARAAEEKFLAGGYATHRREIMYNDFVLIGPKNDPAGIAKAKSAIEAFTDIEKSKSIFVSRGDDSGTNKKELLIWKKAGLDPKKFVGNWYRASGSGMGATLNTGVGMNGYVFTDRASWLNFKNKGDMKLLYAGDPLLFNQYAFLPINSAKYPQVKSDLTKKLEDWLCSPKVQKMIGEYEIAGQQLFTPNAKPK